MTLPSAPSAEIFGMYLENFASFAALGTMLKLPVVWGVRGTLIPSQDKQQGLQLIDSIHSTLNSMAQSYINDHTYNKTEVYRLLKRFVEICRTMLDATYATPSLSSGFFFSETISKLDNFTWQLDRIEKTSDKPWTIPRWASLRDTCDFVIEDETFSAYSLAVLNVAQIVGGYAGSGPAFQNIPLDVEQELGMKLRRLQTILDPFNSEKVWQVLGLLRGKSYNYYLPGGRL